MIPKLRFKADDGSEFPEWKEENVGNLTTELEYYDKLSSGYPLLTSSRAGIMLQSDFRDKITTDNDAAMFSVVPYGKCTYRHMSDDDIFHFNINDIAENGLVSQEYPVFDTINGNSLYLLVEYLNSNRRFRKFCREMKKGGTRTRLYYKYLCEFQLLFPSLPEQKKIAEFLSTIDDIITTTQSELTTWEERKRGVMQKIFNREMRFKADDGSEFPDWEEKKIGELYQKNIERNGNQFTKERTISISTMKYNSEGNGADENSLPNYKVLRLGDIAFEGHENKKFAYGRFVLNDLGDGIMSPRFSCLRPIHSMVNRFWKYYIHYEPLMRQILVRATKKGTMMHELVYDDFYKQIIKVPSIPEQKKIADCLTSLDDVINQIQAELSAWKEFKRGLLRKMFV